MTLAALDMLAYALEMALAALLLTMAVPAVFRLAQMIREGLR